MKDHIKAQLVNSVTSVAQEFHGHQSLRARISDEIITIVNRDEEERLHMLVAVVESARKNPHKPVAEVIGELLPREDVRKFMMLLPTMLQHVLVRERANEEVSSHIEHLITTSIQSAFDQLHLNDPAETPPWNRSGEPQLPDRIDYLPIAQVRKQENDDIKKTFVETWAAVKSNFTNVGLVAVIDLWKTAYKRGARNMQRAASIRGRMAQLDGYPVDEEINKL